VIIAISTITISCSENIDKKKSTIQNSSFVNTTWLLTSINNVKIDYPADYKQNYIIFTTEAEGFKFSGFAGCNNISGTYDVGDHNEIGIKNIVSTKKSCSYSILENDFLNILNNAISYKIEDNTMSIYSKNNKTANFKDSKKLQSQ
jgi:putative lipoprotein